MNDRDVRSRRLGQRRGCWRSGRARELGLARVEARRRVVHGGAKVTAVGKTTSKRRIGPTRQRRDPQDPGSGFLKPSHDGASHAPPARARGGRARRRPRPAAARTWALVLRVVVDRRPRAHARPSRGRGPRRRLPVGRAREALLAEFAAREPNAVRVAGRAARSRAAVAREPRCWPRDGHDGFALMLVAMTMNLGLFGACSRVLRMTRPRAPPTDGHGIR